MIDHGYRFRRQLFHRTAWQALREFFTQPHDIDWREDDHLAGIDPMRDPMEEVKRADAIRYLGARWRGRADCIHKYMRSEP